MTDKIKNEKIREHMLAACKQDGYEPTEGNLLEMLTEGDRLYETVSNERRWWNDTFCVVEINGMKIGFDWADATGDTGIRDLGWEFDWNSICEVVEKQKTITYYEPA